MAPTTSSNLFMFIDLSYMIGSGVLVGMLGILLGIGDIIRGGGTFIVVGHMIGIGVTATHSIIITIGARSVMDITSTTDITNCTAV